MTKARHKSFTSKPRIQTPVTFELDGEAFTAKPAIPGALLLDFIADADSDDGGRAAQALIDFVTNVIVPDDRERFTQLVRDEERIVEIETLAEVVEFLVEEYASRPTESPADSSVGSAATSTG